MSRTSRLSLRTFEEASLELGFAATEALDFRATSRPRASQASHSALAQTLDAGTVEAGGRSPALPALAALQEEVQPSTFIQQSKLLTEANFAFQSALAAWAENPSAASGKRACLVAELDLELARENLEAARALAADLAPLPPDLADRLKALAAHVEERGRAVSRLQRITHEGNLGVAARKRTFFLVALTLVSVSVGIAVLRLAQGGQVVAESGREVFAAAVVVTLLGSLGVFALRGHLLVNRVNRQLVATTGASMAIVVLHRAVDWWAHADAVSTLRTDLFLLALPCFVTAIFVRARVAVSGVALASVGALAALRPELTAILFVVGSAAAVVALAWALREPPPT